MEYGEESCYSDLSNRGLVYISEILVHQIEPLVAATHIPPAFVGLIILPLVGNVAEHSVAITSAVKNKINLSLAIAAESSTQIALFVSPICVLIAGLFGQNFNLIFNKIELLTLGMSIGGVWLVVHDNKSNWWEGFCCYRFTSLSPSLHSFYKLHDSNHTHHHN